jgi:glycosyltransferase involved in cell wall biosynthesis
MTKGRTIAYCAPQAFHFVRKDIEGLRTRCTVRVHLFEHGAKWMLPFDLLHQLWFLLNARRSGLRDVFVHFGGYHAVLPILLGFRTHIIIAGSDACSFPGIRYGGFRKQPLAGVLRFVYRRATTLLPVHHGLERFTNAYSSLGPREQGYASFAKGSMAPSEAIPYGFDHRTWTTSTMDRAPRSIACVATGAAHGNAVHFRKGVDLLIEAAQRLPDHTFTIIGASDRGSYTELPSNLRIMERCTPQEMSGLLSAHTIYAQPSIMEGFPNALCEAMFAGCLPVVSRITSMPEIVGTSGVVIDERSPAALVEAITRLTSMDATEQSRLRSLAHAQVAPYTLDRRIEALLSVLDKYAAER